MSAFLYRLGRSSARHPFRVLGLWLVAAVAVMALQSSAGGQFENSERVPGVESQHAADVLNDRFPTQGGQSARIVLHTEPEITATQKKTVTAKSSSNFWRKLIVPPTRLQLSSKRPSDPFASRAHLLPPPPPPADEIAG